MMISPATSREIVLTVADVAVYLKIPKATVYKLVRQEKIPAHKVGKHWRFIREELEGWLKGS
jgi:excisionase family DNA binding protein